MRSRPKTGTARKLVKKHDSPRESTKKIDKQHKVAARRCTGVRIKRSAEELRILRKEFSQFFRLKKAPDEDSVKIAMNRYHILQKKTVAQIKSRTLFCIQTGR